MLPDSEYKRTSRLLLGIFLVTALAFGAAGYLVYRQLRQAGQQEARTQLSSVADAKLHFMLDWVDERFADARLIEADGPLLTVLDAAVRGAASGPQREQVQHWLDGLCSGGHYANAFVFDPQARLVAKSGDAIGPPGHFVEAVSQALKTRVGVVRDLRLDPNTGKLHLALNMPLRRAPGAEPFGALLLGIDPDRELFPALDLALPPVRGGETLLVRRDGDDALYLNRLEGKQGVRQPARAPLSRTDLVTVKAVLGARDLVEGKDQEGRQVLAAIRAVPGSEWLLVARVPVERIEAPVRQRTLPIAVAFLLVIVAAGLGVSHLWRLQRLRFLEAQHKAEMERVVLASHYNFLRRSAVDAILLLDEEGTILETNDRTLEMYGLTREEMYGRSSALLRSEAERGKYEETWRRAREMSGLLIETQHVRKDGTVFPVESNVRPIVVEGKTYYQAIVRDITQRNLARKQLEDANRLYAVLSEMNHAIASAATEEEVYSSVCRIGTETGGFKIVVVGMLGPGGTQLVRVASAGSSADYARPIPLITPGGEAAVHPVARAFHSGRVCIIDDIAADPDRTPWHERATAFGLGSAACVPLTRQGTTVGVLGIFKAEPHFYDAREISLVEEIGADVSSALGRLVEERKRREAEDALRSSEKRYRQLVESLPVGILVNAAGRIVYMSPAGLRMCGAASLEEIVGKSVYDLVHPDYHAGVRQRSEQGGGLLPAPAQEEKYVRLDGTSYDVEVSAVPIDLEGHPARLVFFTDIAQRKRAEEERARLEQQFLQAQKMESVGRLAGGVAHDFNNHLTIINGYCDMLLAALPPDEPIRAEVAGILKAGQQAAELVRQLLAFSRKRVFEPRQVNLNHVVQDSHRMLERLIGEQIEIETLLARDLGEIMADPTQIQQILMNLAVNARDAMGGSGRLTIETRNVAVDAAQAALSAGGRPGAFVLLRASDTGAGMDNETLRHIFEPFFTTKSNSGGTGLGLSTVYGIVRQSNGWIEVRSAPGAGATFLIYLPCVTREAVPDAAPPPSQASAAGGETVLLVEDQPQVLLLSATILRGLGYSVLEASSGPDALIVAAGHQGPIDILVSDVVMPGMSGPQLARELRAQRPSVKVLYVSGYATEAQASEISAGEGAHHLSKPFTPGSLASKVREVLGAQS